METKKAYISGRVTGLPINDVAEKFSRKAAELQAQGYEVINPVARIISINFSRKRMGEPPLTDEQNRKQIMGISVYDLSQCDELHLLHDWKESQGAMQELAFARSNGIKIVYP